MNLPGSFLYGNCFEKNVIKLGESIEISKLWEITGIENEMIQFKLIDEKFELDIDKPLNNKILYEPIINKFETTNLFSNCDDIPLELIVRFKSSVEYNVKINSKELVISVPFEPDYHQIANYYKNASIKYEPKKIIYGIDVKEGKSTVFLYVTKKRNPFLPDNERHERIFFQIPKGIDEFKYLNQDLRKIKLFYQNVCLKGCEKEFIEEGQIIGKLKNEIWFIEIRFHDREFKIKYKNS